MDPKQYQKAQMQSQVLENKIKDWIDDRSHPIGRRLLDEARAIEDDFQTKQNPRSIEGRIKQFLVTFDELKRYETIIDAQHARWLYDQYEHLQLSLRQFENY